MRSVASALSLSSALMLAVGGASPTAGALPQDCPSILYEECIEGAIEIPGEADCYVFNGEAGHRITVFVEHADESLGLCLFDPSGTELTCEPFSVLDLQIDDFTLPTTGEYVLEVDARDEEVGDYLLCLNRLDHPPVPIGYEECVADTIGVMGDRDYFAFEGEAGHRITAFVDHSGESMGLCLIDPWGTELLCEPFSALDLHIEDLTLPMTGEYVLEVDGRGDDTGDYMLCLSRLDSPPVPIGYEECVADTIDVMGDRDYFAFQGEAGHRITAFVDHSGESMGLCLFDPSGTELICESFSAFDLHIEDLTLPMTGEYVLEVDGREDDTGDYLVCLSRLDSPPVPIGYEECVADTIGVMGDRDYFAFEGEAGHRITAFVDHSGEALAMCLFDPAGTELICEHESGLDLEIDDFALPTTGEYVLEVDGNGDDTGDYVLCLSRVDAPAVPIVYGDCLPDTISPMGDQDVFTFAAEHTGDRVRLFLENTSGTHLKVCWVDPESEMVCCGFSTGDCEVLPDSVNATDSYTAIVDAQGDGTGDYTLCLELLESVPVEESAESVPLAFAVTAGYPNPFGSRTTMTCLLPAATHVRLTIYDVQGRRVATPVNGALPAGAHELSWDGRDGTNAAVRSGTYFLRLQAGDRTETRRVILIR